MAVSQPLRLICLVLIITTSLHDVISFSIRKRHSRSTDLGDALRMLERQRRRFGRPDQDILSSAPELLGGRPLSYDDLEPWFESQSARGSSPEENLDAAWLAKTLGLDGYGAGERQEGLGGLSPEDVAEAAAAAETEEEPLYLQPRPPVKIQPTDQELDAIFGEKEDDKKRSEPVIAATSPDSSSTSSSSQTADKKDKEVMTDMKGDVKQTVPAPKNVKRDNSNGEDVAAVTSSESTTSSDDDVTLTKEEFRALLKAVEKLQKQALSKAGDELEGAADVMAVVKDDLEKAEEVEAAIEEKVKEAEEEAEEAASLAPKPQPVSNEELDSLFQDQTKEVIPTDNGEIVKTDTILRDREGQPVGHEETVEVEEHEGGEGGDEDKQDLKSIRNFWYLNNYLSPDGDRKKRNSKRSYIPVTQEELPPLPEVITPPDSSELIGAYIQKINELQNELDQAGLESYLEDVENDLLTQALHQATLSQARGRILPQELLSLQDAIRVEEALQRVKAARMQTPPDLIEALEEAVKEDEEEEADEAEDAREKAVEEDEAMVLEDKRGEPWKKRSDDKDDDDDDVPIQAEVPVFLTGDSDDIAVDNDDVIDSDDVMADDDDSEEETTSVALGKWLDESAQQPKLNLADLMAAAVEDLEYLENKAINDNDADDNELTDDSSNRVASLFSSTADQCPAVQEFSTNCHFAGDSIDFEARALCNVHEMCYACGESLGVGQQQCDFIYRAASDILCGGEERCELDAEVFLNAMKLKHRFLPHSLPVCRSRCTAQFLSII